MTTETDIDRLAKELYRPRRYHEPPCRAPLSLYNELVGKCPVCGAVILAGPIAPERAAEMLVELKARRVQLGLDPEGGGL